MKRLGLDLGSNSLGWAIYDDTEANFFSDAGVVIFEEGIRREKGADSIETPAAERRRFRMARRLKFRRKLRKFHVLKLLIEKGYCPLTYEELTAWKQQGVYPVANKAYMDWLQSTPEDNPYSARKACVEGKVDGAVLARALYHLAQRRGFKSSRKDAPAAEEEGSNAKSATGAVKSSIIALSVELEKRGETLGQYFFALHQRGDKVRNHYIGRVEHYQKEFDKIAEVQGLDEGFTARLRQVLFSQRPLRSQKNLVGKCVLEKTRSRCMISHPLFEEFRMLSFVNNIRLVDGEDRIPLDDEQRKLACRAFFRKSPTFDFEMIRKNVLGKKSNLELNYPDKTTVGSCPISHQLNEVLGCDFQDWEKTVVSAEGKTVRYDYQTAFDALSFYNDDEKLIEFARNRIGLDEAGAKKFASIHLHDGFAAYSLYAIRKILPFLREGRILSEAVFFAKFPDVIGKSAFAEHQEQILSEIDAMSSDYRDNKKAAAGNSKVVVIPLQRRLKEYLQTNWNVDDEGWKCLYLHTDGSSYDSRTGAERLPIVNLGMMRNPLVQRSLTILRRLINQLRVSGKIDENTIIHIELARSVNNRNTRLAIEQYKKEQENDRQQALQRIQEFGIANPTEDQVLKYLLCEEQGWQCLYTGQSIELSELLNIHTPFDIEHTMPRSRSGDNSQTNKTICQAKYNRDVKKGRLPSECNNYEEIDVRLQTWKKRVDDLKKQLLLDKKRAKGIQSDQPEFKAKAVQKAIVTKLKLDYWRTKLRYFTMTADKIDVGFMNRQLVDTGIMTRHALDFLHSVYPRTYAVNGKTTSWARKAWGIQSIYEAKSRINHTHHAIDAMVIAALDRDAFNKICGRFKDDGTDTTAIFGVDNSMQQFADAVRIISESIVIRHLPRHSETKQTFRNNILLAKSRLLANGEILRKVKAAGDTVRGQLHKESFYGQIQNPNDGGKMQFVIRKMINDESTFSNAAAFDKIVDLTVQKRVREQVEAYQAEGKTFKEAINSDLWMKRAIDDKPGVRINRVRIKTSISDPHELRMHSHLSTNDYKNPYYVESGTGSNFKMAIYDKVTQSKSGVKKHKIETLVVNLLDWAQSHGKPDYIAPQDRTDLGTFIGFIEPGALAIAYKDFPEELQRLCPSDYAKRVYKMVKVKKEDGRITMRLHTEARDAVTLAKSLEKASGESSINFETPHLLLFVSPGVYSSHFLFEGIHFEMSIDGEIKFKS